MVETKKRSMTEGSPVKPLIMFTIPMVVGNLFQQFYNIIDSIIVGNAVGPNALAAVGASTSITIVCHDCGGYRYRIFGSYLAAFWCKTDGKDENSDLYGDYYSSCI